MKLLNHTIVLICALSLLLFVRVIFFAAQYGGIEHDSGWYLGEAKNLALRGIYASYTNTVTDPGVGAFPSIHGRFSVQDAQGFVYFPAGITVGPGYVIPEAIILKLFGNGFWQYRAWPLIGFTAMLMLTLYVVWEVGGFISVAFLFLWLWFLPQFTIQFAYEAFGEDIAFGFLLGGFYLAHKSSFVKSKRGWLLFFSGIALASAYLTKNLFILPAVGVSVFFFADLFQSFRKEKIGFLKRWGVFIGGFLIPVVLFRVYEQGYVMTHFGNAGWRAVMEDYRISFIINGSGVNSMSLEGIKHLDWNFIHKKYLVWLNLGFNYAFPAWVLFVSFPFLLFRIIHKKYRTLLVGLYIGAFVSFAWYLLFSSMGWGRHIWQGLMIEMIFLSISIGCIFNWLKNKKIKIAFLVLLLIGGYFIYNPNMLNGNMFFSEQTIQYWRGIRVITGINGFPSNDIFSLSDEQNLINFFTTHIQTKDRVYYIGWFLNAEVSPLVDKIFYPLSRYYALNQKNPDGGNSYAIFGHYQKGTWAFMPSSYISERTSILCKNIVYQNPTYLICSLRQGIVYSNPSY